MNRPAPRPRLPLPPVLALALVALTPAAPAADGNRLAHLDEPNNAWQFDRGSPVLVTPQWVGEEGVEAAVVLAIDDMSGDGQGFVNYLGPIIARLKEIDGRGPVSITCNRPEPDHANMQFLLRQGVSLETHTLTHPCPLLHGLDFGRAKNDYHGCVDRLVAIPNNRPVGFRFPCMDGQNTPSPRAYAELLNGVSEEGNFMSSSTSVGIVFTPGDRDLPRSIFDHDPAGARRFSRYLMEGFVNYIEDYPYPFVVGDLIWEIPFVYPNDYTGQALHGAQNPVTIADFKAAVDATVVKQGAVSLCFHAGGWMRNGQMADIVDHADRTHGKKVKFFNMREVDDRMVKNLLAGHPLRRPDGGDNGVRVFDIDGDGYRDVLIANQAAKLTRIWRPAQRAWRELPFPVTMGADLRFGVVGGKTVAVAISRQGMRGAWEFTGDGWTPRRTLLAGVQGVQSNVRLLDIDGDGSCELVENAAVYHHGGDRWKKLTFRLPGGTAIETAEGGDAGLRFADLDDDGSQDVIFSNAERFGTWLFESMEKGWSRRGLYGEREEGDPGVGEHHPRDRDVLPPIVRADGTNNGAWIKRGHLYWQNEDTGSRLPHHIDQRSFGDLLGDQVNHPRSPGASLRAMQPRPGFRVELVASEPLVRDPVDIAWGPDGRMWVCEMADYPSGIDNRGTPGSRVAFLTDTDGDGRYDQRTLFADGIGFATTVLPWRDGVLVVAAPSISLLRDTDGDGRADETRVLYEGFGQGNQQHRVNGLAWGLDGWLHVANGDSGGHIRSTRTGESVGINGFDLRIRPDTGELERTTGFAQHGRNRDDWGNWVAGNNSNAWQVALEDHDIRRNPDVKQPAARHGIHGVIDLYPASRVLSHWEGYQPPPAGSPGKLTSGCGYTFYRDSFVDGLVEESVYSSCPVHNCVHREVVTWEGVLMETARARDEARTEFLRSSDSWFRPTALRTGPDGALYLADLYRFVIEHPEWIDDTLEKEMVKDGRMRAGHEQGRIYKIYPEGAQLRRPADLARLDSRGLAAAIDSPNGWQRDTAHMMLTWRKGTRGEKAAVERLRTVLRSSQTAAARVQSLSALADLGALAVGDVAAGLADEHPGVRRNALRVGEELLGKDAGLGARAAALLGDPDAHVQRQAAYALGGWEDERAGAALGEFLLAHADRPYLRAAALTSAGKFPDLVLARLLAAERTPETAGLVNSVLDMLGSGNAAKFVPRVLERITDGVDGAAGYEAWMFAATARLLDAVGDAGGRAAVRPKLAPMFEAAAAAVGDEKQDLGRRLAAVSLVERSGAGGAAAERRLSPLLEITTPVELQVAAVNALLGGGDTAVATRLLKGWPGYGAAVRTAVLDAMLVRSELAAVLLESMEESTELAASLDVARRGLLLTHGNPGIRGRAERVLGGATRPDRAALMDDYAPALSRAGDPGKGREVFAAACAACHRLDGVGQVIGPDLAALGNRSPLAYLTGILDPNRAIEAKWMQFTAQTKDGRDLAGAVAEETSAAITLVGIDGARTTVPRRELASLKSAGRSLMPEGLEAAIDIDQMADLLAYLRFAGKPIPQVAVKGNTIEHLDTLHDGFYTVTFDPVAGATGIDLEWENEGRWKHWAIREIEAYDAAAAKVEITGGKVVPGPVRTSNNVFANAFDGDVGTMTYITESGTSVAPQRTLLKLAPGGHQLDRIRINDVAGNDTNGRLKQITVRVTTDDDADLAARTYVDVANLSVQLFGGPAVKTSAKPEPEPGPFGGKPHRIPGVVEAEHYDEGPAGVAYADSDKKNHGADYRKNTQVDIEKRPDAANGHGIGWTRAGEWLNYTVDVAEGGTYEIDIDVASPGPGGLFAFASERRPLTRATRLPDTGAWTNLERITIKDVKLEKGVQTLRLDLLKTGGSGYVGDIDCFVFRRVQ